MATTSPAGGCPDCQRSVYTRTRQPHYDHVHTVEVLPRPRRRDDHIIVHGYAVGFAGFSGLPQTWVFFEDLEPAIVFGRAARMSGYDVNHYGVTEAAREARWKQHRGDVVTLYLKAGSHLRDHPNEKPILERWVRGCNPKSAYFEAGRTR